MNKATPNFSTKYIIWENSNAKTTEYESPQVNKTNSY